MKWKIKYNDIFNYEMKNLNFISFKLMTQLRTGHNYLNAQRKWGNNKICENNNCNKQETNIHFFF